MSPKSPEITEYIDSLREDIDRHDGTLPTAVGMVISAASSCWSNLSGAGVFESERASALVDLLLSYTGPFEPSASSPETGERAVSTETTTVTYHVLPYDTWRFSPATGRTDCCHVLVSALPLTDACGSDWQGREPGQVRCDGGGSETGDQP